MKYLIYIGVIITILMGCSNGSDKSSADGRSPVVKDKDGNIMPAATTFLCQASDGSREATCNSKAEYCLVTEVPSGFATTLECTPYPSSGCTSQSCLEEDAKALFPNVENCKHTIVYSMKNGQSTIRCIHPYL